MKENFKLIVDFPDYEISNLGNVKAKSRKISYNHANGDLHFRTSKERLLKIQYNNSTGYLFVQLYKNKKMFNCVIHRLKAKAFIPNPLNLPCLNHKDGNKLNNDLPNLEWCSNEYNHKHASEHNLKAKGSRIGTSKLNEKSVKEIKKLLTKGVSQFIISKRFNVSRCTITQINTNKTWKHVN